MPGRLCISARIALSSALISSPCTLHNRTSKRSLNLLSQASKNFSTICVSSRSKRFSSSSSRSEWCLTTALLSVTPALFFSHTQRNRESSRQWKAASRLHFFDALAFVGIKTYVSAVCIIQCATDHELARNMFQPKNFFSPYIETSLCPFLDFLFASAVLLHNLLLLKHCNHVDGV